MTGIFAIFSYARGTRDNSSLISGFLKPMSPALKSIRACFSMSRFIIWLSRCLTSLGTKSLKVLAPSEARSNSISFLSPPALIAKRSESILLDSWEERSDTSSTCRSLVATAFLVIYDGKSLPLRCLRILDMSRFLMV